MNKKSNVLGWIKLTNRQIMTLKKYQRGLYRESSPNPWIKGGAIWAQLHDSLLAMRVGYLSHNRMELFER